MVKILYHYAFRDNNTYLCAITVHGLIFPACRRRHKDGAYQSLHFVTVGLYYSTKANFTYYIFNLSKKNVGLLGYLAMSSISSS